MGYIQKTVGIRREEKLGNDLGIYIHVPFCIKKCAYCDFKSVVTSQIPEKRYAECVLKELSYIIRKESFDKDAKTLQTVYIGGGTPSLFSPATIAHIISSVKGFFNPSSDLEATIEVNPDTVDTEKLKGFRSGGVNRISIGVQSLNDRNLKALGRTHTGEKALFAFDSARLAGFDNIGVDLIFGIPGQTNREWEDSLLKVVKLRPEHISLYGLTLEEGTPFFRAYVKKEGAVNTAPLPSEEEEARMYGSACEILKEGGWRHYEISNWGFPGYYSKHNQRYWLGGDYLGLGVSSHSYLSYPGWGRRWWNDTSPANYMARIEGEGSAVAGSEELGREEAVKESLLLGLRMLERGIEGEGFKKRFGAYPKEVFGRWAELEKEGFLASKGKDLLLTPKGVLLSNALFLRMLD